MAYPTNKKLFLLSATQIIKRPTWKERRGFPKKLHTKDECVQTGQEENLKKKLKKKKILLFSGQATTEAARPHEQEYRCMNYSYEQRDSQQ